MVERKLSGWSKVSPGEEYTLLSTDYFKNYNGIRVKVRDVVDTPMEVDDSLTCPVVYIDLGHLRRLFALPEGRGFPFLLSPHRASHALSIRDSLDLARIRAAAPPGVEAYTVSTVSVNLNKSSPALPRPPRHPLLDPRDRADGGDIGQPGHQLPEPPGRFRTHEGLRLLGLEVARLRALGKRPGPRPALYPRRYSNVAFGLAVKPFKVLYSFTLSPRAGIVGFAVILGASIVLWLASSIQPYRYLKRIDPVIIMREE